MAPFGTIYSYPNNPRVAKVQAVAKLNGLEIEVPVFKMGEENQSPEFLAKFPLGKVPAFAAADGTTLFESDAIALYVAESGPAAPQLVGTTPAERATIRQWICFSENEVLNPVIQLVLPRVGMRPFDEAVEKTALQRLERSLGAVETHMQGRTWLATEQRSLADISLATSLTWGFSLVIDAEMRAKFPTTVSWYEKIVESEDLKDVFGEKKFVEKRQVPQ